MTTGQIIDGKAHALRLRAEIAQQVITRAAAGARAPCLAVVLVGEDPASQVYVKNKISACRDAGITSIEHRRDAALPEAELLALVEALNRDSGVDGILVQLPLPPHIDSAAVISAISPDKDVDGFHPVNAGRLATGLDGFVPCTPLGCLRLLEA
ncbi:tetrahydrofolate dehydrogenase/cyclohydrolase catalytic domain-containing protein, partial [Sandaracinobacter sp.]|uniref:tetrahydrofolate dehydrogenase/cyclohydrolase catalytic domain-containing protein n=1 Tax=Sandaracinobacter sp. TaxID=2487581 RepID=UPI0035B0319A